MPDDMPKLMAKIILSIDLFSLRVGQLACWLTVPVFTAMFIEVVGRHFFGSPTMRAYDISTTCVGPLGKCLEGGRCEPDDKDGGCQCDSEQGPYSQCGADPASNPCIDPDQPCECDSYGDCIINYLPEVTACGDEFLNGCMVNRYVRSRRFPVFLFVTAIFRIPFAVHKNNETMRRSLTFPFPKQVHR